jgi:hypothetical protein
MMQGGWRRYLLSMHRLLFMGKRELLDTPWARIFMVLIPPFFQTTVNTHPN